MGVIIYCILLLSFSSFIYSQSSTTTRPTGCPGGSVAYQDIAILYEISYFPDNTSLDFSRQIASVITSTLFSGPTYQYYEANGSRATQITSLPFPNTILYNTFTDDHGYGFTTSNDALINEMNRQLNDAHLGTLSHPTNSKISDGLFYLTQYIQNGKRPAPVVNTIVIIAKSDSDVFASSQYTDNLKSSGSKIMTIGVGNGKVADLSGLSSGGGYSFNIPDLTNTTAVNSVAQSIAQKLTTDCGTTWTAAPTTTPLPTSPYTGTTTIPSSTTLNPAITTSTTPTPAVTTTTTPALSPSTASPTTNIPASPSSGTSGTPVTQPPPNSNAPTSTTIPTTTPATTRNNHQYPGDNGASIASFSFIFLCIASIFAFVNRV